MILISTLSIVFFFSVTLSVGIMITERCDDIYVRYFVAGVTEVELLMSHVILSTVLMFIQTFMVFIFSFYVFMVPCNGDIILVVWLMMLTGFCGLFFGNI